MKLAERIAREICGASGRDPDGVAISEQARESGFAVRNGHALFWQPVRRAWEVYAEDVEPVLAILRRDGLLEPCLEEPPPEQVQEPSTEDLVRNETAETDWRRRHGLS